MKLFVALVVSCSIVSYGIYAIPPTTADIANAKTVIRQLIVDNVDNTEGYVFIAGFVRLAFHDCIGNGGCDGCVNHEDGHNAGLLKYTNALDTIYPQFELAMTRADFWALAAVTALENATDSVTDKFSVADDEFKVGRIDCGAYPSETSTGPFPSEFFNFGEMKTYFADNFGFTTREIVALMGAHTLGRARAEDSGFEGRWVPGRTNGIRHTDVLDNGYYFNLRGTWIQQSIVDPNGNTKLQWQRSGFEANTFNNTNANGQSSMYMNSDLCLSWEFDASTSGTGDGSISCTIERGVDCRTSGTCCGKSEADNDYEEFVNDNVLWLEEFKAVFLKMIERNTADLLTPNAAKKRDAAEKKLNGVEATLENVLKDISELEERIQDTPNEKRINPKFRKSAGHQ